MSELNELNVAELRWLLNSHRPRQDARYSLQYRCLKVRLDSSAYADYKPEWSEWTDVPYYTDL